jgi:hypothetical protein
MKTKLKLPFVMEIIILAAWGIRISRNNKVFNNHPPSLTSWKKIPSGGKTTLLQNEEKACRFFQRIGCNLKLSCSMAVFFALFVYLFQKRLALFFVNKFYYNNIKLQWVFPLFHPGKKQGGGTQGRPQSGTLGSPKKKNPTCINCNGGDHVLARCHTIRCDMCKKMGHMRQICQAILPGNVCEWIVANKRGG